MASARKKPKKQQLEPQSLLTASHQKKKKKNKLKKTVGPVVNPKSFSASPSSKGIQDRGISEIEQRRRIEAIGGPTSSIAPGYDARKPDERWICVFCKRSSHFQGMGDLFGPYFVSKDVFPADMIKPSQPELTAAKFIVG